MTTVRFTVSFNPEVFKYIENKALVENRKHISTYLNEFFTQIIEKEKPKI